MTWDPHAVTRSQDGPALLSWRQVSYGLLAAGLAICGLWLHTHIRDVELMRDAILANQGAIIKINEQIKTIVDNSQEAKRWREEERAWRYRIEMNVDLLMQETGAAARRIPSFGRDSQTNGTKKPRQNPPWDH